MDILLRGYLKCKAKGSWPKNWTKLWFILRYKSDGTKQLEYYENEKKSTVTNAVPKGIIDLSNVMLVQRLPEPDKKTQFMITFSGAVQYRHFDAPSEYNMEEWVTSLNSIIFSKIIGDVVFAVDMHKTEAVPFYGPCELILKAEIITVRNRVSSKNPHQQQFQWSIAHVKKFWVKSDVHQLVITVGRQSSTGPGEFVFTTAQSMQIMHGITAMLNEAKRKHGLNMPMTAPSTIETHTTLDRPISTDRSQSAKVKIAPYASKHPQKVSTLPAGYSHYNKTVFGTNSATGNEGYDVLSHHNDKEKRLSVMSQPYDMLDHSKSARTSVHSLHLSPHVSPRVSPRTSPSNSRKSSYSSLNAFGDAITEEVDEPPLDGGGDYGKLNHNNRPPELPSKRISSQGAPFESEYGKLDHNHSHPSELPPKRAVQENEYGKLNYSNQHATLEPHSEYGRLNHSNRTPELPQTKPIIRENAYGELDHSNQHETTLESEGEYGKLNHTSQTNELPQKTVVQENVYGKLDHSNQHEAMPEPQSEYGKLHHVDRPPELLPKRKTVQESEYGKLDHSKRYVRTPEPHGEHGKPSYTNTNYQNQGENFSPDAQQSEYGKLSHKPQITDRRKQLQEHSSNSGKEEVLSSPQTNDLPLGYATFKTEHGYSISSSISSYSSDVDDDKDDLVPNDEKYSQLNLTSVDNGDSKLAESKHTPAAADSQPRTSYAPTKPKPKPRNI